MSNENKVSMEHTLDFLNKFYSNYNCVVCGSNDWTTSDNLYELRKFNFGEISVQNSAIIPIVPVMCKNCGNTHLVNAILAGAIESRTKIGVQNGDK